MDYRYETKDNAREFHQRRKAFIILNDKLEFLPDGSSMSHYEYCQKKGLSKEEFNKITRGFYLNDNLIFYKDNFIYDDNLIEESLSHLNEIASILNIEEFDVYFGENPNNNFAPDFYYGKYVKGNIQKNMTM